MRLLPVGVGIAAVERPAGRDSQPFQRELERSRIGLLGARLGRAHGRIEMLGKIETLQMVAQGDVPVGDAGEREPGRPQRVERGDDVREEPKRDRGVEIGREDHRVEVGLACVEEDACAVLPERSERLRIAPGVRTGEVVLDLGRKRPADIAVFPLDPVSS